MNVSRQDVIEICEIIGFKTASKWGPDRMKKKLANLVTADDLDLSDELEDERLLAVWEAIVEAKGIVEIVDGSVEEEVDDELVEETDGEEDDEEIEEDELEETESVGEEEEEVIDEDDEPSIEDDEDELMEEAEEEPEPEPVVEKKKKKGKAKKGKKKAAKKAKKKMGPTCIELVVGTVCENPEIGFPELREKLEQAGVFSESTARTTFSSTRRVIRALQAMGRLEV